MTTVRIPLPFANTGTVTPIDVTRTDGVVNLQQGYTDDYSRELGVDPSAKAVERDKLNYLFNLITANLQDWQLSAVPQWLSPNAYAINAFVRYTPTVGQTEKIYRCIANAPSGATPLNTSYWEEVITVSAMKALIPMIDSGLISVATDFNGIARGWWSITDPAVASGSANSPSGQPGILACYRWGAGAGTAQQVYYAVDGTTYSRGYNGASWSAWKSNAGLSGILPVTQGGTGVGSVTAGSFLRGNGTNALVERTPAQVLTDIGAATAAQGAKADTALQPADITGKYDKTGGPITGNVTVSGTLGVTGAITGSTVGMTGAVSAGGGNGAGMLDVRTGQGGILFRTMSFTGGAADSATIDGVNNANSAFSDLNFRAVKFSFLTTANTRLLIRDSGTGTISIDAVNSTNTNFASMNHTAQSYFFNGGNAVFNGAVSATGGFQNSDRYFKKNIKRRPVQRGIALSLARWFSEWDRKADGEHDVGLVAQTLRRIAPHYTKYFNTSKRGKKRLSIDKAGVALECSFDNALAIDELIKENKKLLARIEKLERKNK